MDTHQIEAWAAATLADELVGFEPIVMDEPRERETGSARVARERREAAERQRRSRARRQRTAEVSDAIAYGVGRFLRRRGVKDRIRTETDMVAEKVPLYDLFGEAMTILIEEYGWARDEAAKAVNDRLLR